MSLQNKLERLTKSVDTLSTFGCTKVFNKIEQLLDDSFQLLAAELVEEKQFEVLQKILPLLSNESRVRKTLVTQQLNLLESKEITASVVPSDTNDQDLPERLLDYNHTRIAALEAFSRTNLTRSQSYPIAFLTLKKIGKIGELELRKCKKGCPSYQRMLDIAITNLLANGFLQYLPSNADNDRQKNRTIQITAEGLKHLKACYDLLEVPQQPDKGIAARAVGETTRESDQPVNNRVFSNGSGIINTDQPAF